MNIEQLDIERHQLPGLLKRTELVGIELGVASGDYSAKIYQTGCFSRLYGVDMYADHHDVDEYCAALRLVGLDANYWLLRMRFDQALSLFEDGSFDFVYIDGYAHTGEDSGRTLFDWFAKVKVGGMIAGHDFHPDWPLVQKSVTTLAQLSGLNLMQTRKTENPGPQDDFPSWAILKSRPVEVSYPDELRSLYQPKPPKKVHFLKRVERKIRKALK